MHVTVTTEHAGSTTLINSGTVFVKNSLWARSFLSKWWTFADRTLHSDQEQFDLLYSHLSKQADWKPTLVAILEPDAINTDPPAMTQLKPHNQVLHLMVT